MSPGTIVKYTVLEGFRRLGINRVARRLLRDHLLVLCYHGVLTERPANTEGLVNTVSLAEFRRQLEFLASRFHPITTADLLASRSGTPLPPNPVLVTFDDGYRNNLTVAAGALREKGVPCVFFVTTGYIGTNCILWTDELMARLCQGGLAEAPHPDGCTVRLEAEARLRRATASAIKQKCKHMPTEAVESYLTQLRNLTPAPVMNEECYGFMNWDEVRRLRQMGFEIGSHTASHPILTRVTAERLETELAESKHKIEEETGGECCSIAYPNGDFSDAVLASARRAGYKTGVTMAGRHSVPEEDLLEISRVSVAGYYPASVLEYRASGLPTLLRTVF